MADSWSEIAVYADTNLGTHFAAGVPWDITGIELKRELERVHCSCFPSLGDIAIEALMVKKNVHTYHLPDSAPILHFFKDSERSWFLNLKISQINFAERKRKKHKRNRCVKKRKRINTMKRMIWFSRIIPLLRLRLTTTTRLLSKNKRRRHIVKVRHRAKGGRYQDQKRLNEAAVIISSREVKLNREGRTEGWEDCCHSHPGMMVDNSPPSGGSLSSDAVPSVSGLISRYFSSIIESDRRPDNPSRLEVNSRKRAALLSSMPCKGEQTPPPPLVKCTDPARRIGEIERSEVGKRLVHALGQLETAEHRQNSMTPFCSPSERRRLFGPGSSDCSVRNLVFEIGNDSD